ncbi:hypothetical protein [Marinomonas transparens]|uniref:Uncharacterized protein n=1 Tax=Marinomonas transparens TaxID=2795388 RepID=A0A934JUA4_9GAMM|nr:hypothetical protein [Marinomonas transparens]MBJ7538427.1 hypothetical protein [Marinomonas transparens]
MKILPKETLLVCATGVIPALIVQYREGINQLKEFVSGAVVPDYLFFYFLLFFVTHFFSALFLWLYGYKISPDNQRTAKTIIKYIGAVGDTTLGIYRLTAGLLFAIPLLWKWVEPDNLNNIHFVGLISLALLFFGGVFAISSINTWAHKR